jgi:cystathionine beta-synthase
VGGSAGSAVVAAIKVAKRFKKGQRVVVILPDSVRNYMSKFLNDNWMVENGFMEEQDTDHKGLWWWKKTVADLRLQTPLTISSSLSCGTAIEIMSKEGYDQLPVVSPEGTVEGTVTLGNLTSQITRGSVSTDDACAKATFKQFKQVSLSTSLGKLSKIFDKDHFALVVHSNRNYTSPDQISEKSVVFGIVTRIDLLDYIVKHPEHSSSSSNSTNSTTSASPQVPSDKTSADDDQSKKRKRAD